jgi:hypothetical protein
MSAELIEHTAQLQTPKWDPAYKHIWLGDSTESVLCSYPSADRERIFEEMTPDERRIEANVLGSNESTAVTYPRTVGQLCIGSGWGSGPYPA